MCVMSAGLNRILDLRHLSGSQVIAVVELINGTLGIHIINQLSGLHRCYKPICFFSN